MKDRDDDEIRDTSFTLWSSKIIRAIILMYAVFVFFCLPAQGRAFVILLALVAGLLYMCRERPAVHAQPARVQTLESTYDSYHNRLLLKGVSNGGHHDHIPDTETWSVGDDMLFRQVMLGSGMNPKFF